ncbi:MAG: alpha/beta fold hydrolase [Chloroflexi bacterium]|nr:alpha/beta fold hydrolase [Chloroflexota bacterium]
MNEHSELFQREVAPVAKTRSGGVLSRRDLLRRAGLTAGAAVALGLGLESGAGLAPSPALAATASAPGPTPSIVLVHGAWADGSGWNEVIALLQLAGYPVTGIAATATPLSTLAEDVARVQSVLALQAGPTVLVGHSIGGAVISGAGSGEPNVKALVYVSAFAPDIGESIGQLVTQKGFPPEPGTAPSSLIVDQQGYAYLTRQAFRQYFAPDIPAEMARLMAATQRPVNGAYLGDVAVSAAWHTLPSWFLVSTQDQMINPDLQRFEAQRMGAKTLEVASSHASLLSHPWQVVQLVDQAAQVAVAA